MLCNGMFIFPYMFLFMNCMYLFLLHLSVQGDTSMVSKSTLLLHFSRRIFFSNLFFFLLSYDSSKNHGGFPSQGQIGLLACRVVFQLTTLQITLFLDFPIWNFSSQESCTSDLEIPDLGCTGFNLRGGSRGAPDSLELFCSLPLEIVLLKFIIDVDKCLTKCMSSEVCICNEIRVWMRVYTAIRLPFLFHTSTISSKSLSECFSGDSMIIFIKLDRLS